MKKLFRALPLLLALCLLTGCLSIPSILNKPSTPAPVPDGPDETTYLTLPPESPSGGDPDAGGYASGIRGGGWRTYR